MSGLEQPAFEESRSSEFDRWLELDFTAEELEVFDLEDQFEEMERKQQKKRKKPLVWREKRGKKSTTDFSEDCHYPLEF